MPARRTSSLPGCSQPLPQVPVVVVPLLVVAVAHRQPLRLVVPVVTRVAAPVVRLRQIGASLCSSMVASWAARKTWHDRSSEQRTAHADPVKRRAGNPWQHLST